MSTRYAIEYDNINNEFCSFGCGQIAKFKYKNGKVCCCYIKTKCSKQRDKNRESNIGRKPPPKTEEFKENQRQRMLNGQAKKMNEVPRDPEKKRINDEKSRERMLNGQAKKMNEIDPIGRVKKIRKAKEELSYVSLYKHIVERFTLMSTKKKFTRDELKTRGRKGNSIDHIFSVMEGYLNKIPPCVIACEGNLRLISYSSNSSKRERSDISLDELINFFNSSNDIKFNLNERKCLFKDCLYKNNKFCNILKEGDLAK